LNERLLKNMHEVEAEERKFKGFSPKLRLVRPFLSLLTENNTSRSAALNMEKIAAK